MTTGSSSSGSSSSSSSSSSSMTKNTAQPAISALDSVLDTLKGPKTVSTVAKSNYDWETFKEKVIPLPFRPFLTYTLFSYTFFKYVQCVAGGS